MKVIQEIIPSHLEGSPLYETLFDDEEHDPTPIKLIDLPIEVIKLNLRFTDAGDVRHFLETQRFWGSNEIIDEMLNFCLNNYWSQATECDVEDLINVLSIYRHDLPYTITLIELIQWQQQKCRTKQHTDQDTPLLIALKAQHLPIVRFLHKVMGYAVTDRTVREAIKMGYLDFLKYVSRESILKLDRPCYVECSASHGQLECLKYYVNLQPSFSKYPAISCWYRAAARKGHVPCIQFIQSLDESSSLTKLPDLKSYFICAVESGVVAAMEAILQHAGLVDLRDAATSSVMRAAELGHLDSLRFLINAGFHSNLYSACERAVCSGQFRCLQYLHQHGYMIQPRWAGCAAMYGHTDCLRYILQHVEIVDRSTSICSLAARKGHIECLKVAHEMGIPASSRLCEEAAASGNFQCLKFVHDVMGCELSKDVYITATKIGSMEIIDYAVMQNVPLSSLAIAAAIESDRYDFMKQLYERGFSLSPHDCDFALKRGRLQHFLFIYNQTKRQHHLQIGLLRFIFKHILVTYLQWVEYIHVQWGWVKSREVLWTKSHSWRWHRQQEILALVFAFIYYYIYKF